MWSYVKTYDIRVKYQIQKQSQINCACISILCLHILQLLKMIFFPLHFQLDYGLLTYSYLMFAYVATVKNDFLLILPSDPHLLISGTTTSAQLDSDALDWKRLIGWDFTKYQPYDIYNYFLSNKISGMFTSFALSLLNYPLTCMTKLECLSASFCQNPSETLGQSLSPSEAFPSTHLFQHNCIVSFSLVFVFFSARTSKGRRIQKINSTFKTYLFE